MAISDVLSTGMLVATVGAGLTLAQNQLQVSGSGRTLDPVKLDLPAGATAPPAGTRAAFVETDPIVLNLAKSGVYEANVLLYNAHCSAETVALSVQLFDRNGDPLPVGTTVAPVAFTGTGQETAQKPDAEGRWAIDAGTYATVRLQVASADKNVKFPPPSVARDAWSALTSGATNRGGWTGHLPAKGAVVLSLYTPRSAAAGDPCPISGTVPSSARRPLVLEPPLPPAIDTGLLLASLLLAGLTVLVAAAFIFASADVFLRGRMGEVAFDFKNSWGANVAIGTGILAAITGGTILAKDQYSNNSTTYLVLTSLFAALVPLGAALYALLRRPEPVGAGTEPHGYVSAYLLSTGIVLWGAFGQLLVFGMMLRELSLARVMSPEATTLLIALARGLVGLLAIYGVLNARATVTASSERKPTGEATPRPPAAMV